MKERLPNQVRLLLFYARNPQESLTTSDVAQKLGLDGMAASNMVNRNVRLGILEAVKTRGRAAEYRIGPVLRKEIGSAGGEIVEAS